MNPHTSPWNRPQASTIQDDLLRWKWRDIEKHISGPVVVSEYRGLLAVQTHKILIAKHSRKFRLTSHLDWACYTPRQLAQAIDNSCCDAYYEFALQDPGTDLNEWQDTAREQRLRAFYAARAGRCSQISQD